MLGVSSCPNTREGNRVLIGPLFLCLSTPGTVREGLGVRAASPGIQALSDPSLAKALSHLLSRIHGGRWDINL